MQLDGEMVEVAGIEPASGKDPREDLHAQFPVL